MAEGRHATSSEHNFIFYDARLWNIVSLQLYPALEKTNGINLKLILPFFFYLCQLCIDCVDVSLGLAAPTPTCRCDIGSVVRPVNSCLLHVLAAAQQSFLLSPSSVIHKLDPNLYMLCLLPFFVFFCLYSRIDFILCGTLFFSPFFLRHKYNFPWRSDVSKIRVRNKKKKGND